MDDVRPQLVALVGEVEAVEDTAAAAAAHSSATS